ncbi:MAG: mismatch repair protein MutT [Candidatus Saccharibacteria bacterium]|nr:mismatch repair protein MutT [Candidatus Saccharibacteria bacterium]
MKNLVIAKSFIFDANGKLLVLTRSTTHSSRGGWPDIPGGHAEKGEASYEAVAARELSEETGLSMNPSQLQLFFTNTHYDTGTNAIRFFYAGTLSEEEPAVVLSDEHEAYRWVAPEDVDDALEQDSHKLMVYHYGLRNHLF